MSADVSARLAWPNDAPAIAQIQRQHWLATFGETIAEADLAAFDETAMAARWTKLISAPPDARIRTLVALERANIRGFAIVHPCHDPDADQIVDGEITDALFPIEAQRASGVRFRERRDRRRNAQGSSGIPVAYRRVVT